MSTKLPMCNGDAGKKVKYYSQGMKRRLELARCFLLKPKLMLLDEPTTGLDPISLIHLKDIIQEEKSKGKTILITTHIMSFVEEVADEIVFLLDGEIYFKGSTKNLKSQTDQPDLEHAIAYLMKKDNV